MQFTHDMKLRVPTSVIWISAGQAGAVLALLVGTRVLTELIEPGDFGKIALTVGVVSLMVAGLFTPIFQGMVRFYPEAEQGVFVAQLRRVVRRILVVSCAIVIATAGAAVAWSTYARNGLLFLICGGTMLVFAEALRAGLLAHLNVARRHANYGLLITLDAFARPLVAVALILVSGAAAEQVVFGYAVGTLFMSAAFLWRTWDAKISDSSRRDGQDLETDLKRFAYPLIPTAVLSCLLAYGDRYLLATLVSLQDVGIYAAAYALVSRPYLMLQTTFETALRPDYLSAIAGGNLPESRRILRDLFKWSFCGSVILTACFYYGAQVVAGLLLARDYSAAATLMPWIAGGHVFLVLSYNQYMVLMAAKRTKLIPWIRGGAGLLALISIVEMTGVQGVLGAARACVIYFGSEAVFLALLISVLRKRNQ